MRMQNIEGQTVPSARFKPVTSAGIETISTDDIFSGKTVVVFSLPGAFTPTCSSSHLPRYDELAPLLHKAGVDEIVCLSVNDGFVMKAWESDQACKNVRVLPDGNGEFTRGMGALVEKDDLGFGHRSWRYSMLVRDGKIEKMFIEPDQPGDPFEVSDADTMLKHLAPEQELPKKAALFTRDDCGHCRNAKVLLEEANISFEEIKIGKQANTPSALAAVTGATTVPQLYVDGKLIGDGEAIKAWAAV